MRRRLTAVLFTAAMTSGCASSLTGRWTSTQETPPEPKFFIREIRFLEDGSYFLGALEGEQNIVQSGDYTFNGLSLILRPGGLGERRYPAVLWWGELLELHVQDERQVLRKR